MTKKELGRIYYLNNEIDMWRKELNRLQTMSLLPSQEINGMPFASGTSDKVGNLAVNIAEIEQKIKELQTRVLDEYKKILEYIKTIDDSLMRQIIYHRHILCMSWGQVAKAVGGSNNSDSLRKMHDRFLQEK